MDRLNSGSLELALLALAFGGLQLWWIGTMVGRRQLSRPLSEGEFRKTLERIWAQSAQKR